MSLADDTFSTYAVAQVRDDGKLILTRLVAFSYETDVSSSGTEVRGKCYCPRGVDFGKEPIEVVSARQLQRNKQDGFPEWNEVARTAAESKSRRITAKQKDSA